MVLERMTQFTRRAGLKRCRAVLVSDQSQRGASGVCGSAMQQSRLLEPSDTGCWQLAVPSGEICVSVKEELWRNRAGRDRKAASRRRSTADTHGNHTVHTLLGVAPGYRDGEFSSLQSSNSTQ